MSLFATPSAAQQAPTKSLGNINADNLNSNQQGIPIPYLAGRQLIAGLFMTPAYNVVHKPIKTQTGKGSSSTSGFTDFCDFGLALCMGGRMPVSKIGANIAVNAEVVWKNNSLLSFGGAEYVDITLPNYGQIRIYRGSFTQPIDTLVLGTRGLVGALDPRDVGNWPFNPSGGNPTFNGMAAGDSNPLSGHYDRHPAYRPVCYMVAKSFKLGRNPSPIPTIEIELQRDVPWFAGVAVDRNATGLNSDQRGVNPIGVLYDLITDPVFGLNQPDSALYLPGWTDALNKCANIRISPKLSDLKSVKDRFDEFTQYFDGRFRDRDGLIDLVVYDHGPIDLTKVPILTDDDLDGEPAMKPLDWSHIIPLTVVTYSDREHYYNDRQQKFKNVNARRVVGNLPPSLQDKPHITDKDVAKQWVTEFGFINSQPIQSGQLPIKREWMDDNATAPDAVTRQIREGDRILFNSASRSISALLRLNEYDVPDDKSGRANLDIANEPGQWPALYVPPAQNLLGNFQIEPVAISNARIVALPAGLRTRQNELEVAALAMRPRHETIGFAVYTSVDNSTYDPGPPNNNYAAFGLVGVNYPATTGDTDDVTGVDVDLFGWDQDRIVALTNTQRDDNTGLLWCEDEIMSWGQVTPLGNGRFRFFCKRKQYGTAKVAHNAGANCWFIFRSELTPITNANFAAGATRYFKLDPYTPLETLDLGSVTAIVYIFPAAPAFTSISGLTLTTAAKVAEGKTPYVTIIAVWTAAADPNVVSFEYNFQKVGDANWQGSMTANMVVDFAVDPATLYNVRVRAIDNLGPGDWCATQQILSGTLSPFQVTHFELDGQANNLVFGGRIAKLRWGIDSQDSFQEIGQEENGIQAGEEDPLFKDYLLELYDPTSGALLWDRSGLQPPKYDLDVVEAVGVKRSIVAQVTKRSTVQNLVSAPNRITISNPVPAAMDPMSLIATPSYNTVDFQFPLGNATDLAGVVLLRSLNNNFLPADAGVEVFDLGLVSKATIPQSEATSYYYRAALYDDFMPRPLAIADISTLNFCKAFLIKTSTLTPTLDAPSIDPPDKSFSAAFDISVVAAAGQTVRDTTNGTPVISTTPEWPKASGVYTTIHVPIGADLILRVRGYLADGTPTKERIVKYTYVTAGAGGGTCATPSLSYTGTLGGAANVTLADATSGATIKYSKNGAAFVTYTTAVALAANDTLEYYATKSGLNDSAHDTFTNTKPAGGGDSGGSGGHPNP